ncbi:flagellar export chaperone FliS [Desulfonatronospira sp.]|uniref:flagellar export chaperone FliS n=1 Tax=Desulfonatronospira sp. TaxID=1962951 RepID=UPI0025BC87A4|nr:flagellar export chaperone FliS [Desulfonatronospira sp.]
MYSNAARAYFQTKVKTTTKEDLVVQLYEAAVKFLEQAKEKIIEKDYIAKGERIDKALLIIGELNSSLNAEKGGEIAQHLHAFYANCQARILMASLKLDIEKLDEVINMLKQVASAFAEVNRKQKNPQ